MKFRFVPLLALVGLLAVGSAAAAPAHQQEPAASTTVIINEVFYGTPNSNIQPTYVELRNLSNSAVNLAGYRMRFFQEGVSEFEYTFPTGASIAANGYVVIYESAGTNTATRFYAEDFTDVQYNTAVTVRLINTNTSTVIDTVRLGDELNQAIAPGDTWVGRTMPPPYDNATISVGFTSDIDTDSARRWQHTIPSPAALNVVAPSVHISEVDVGEDASGLYDAVELRNPSNAAVNLNGWQLRLFAKTAQPAANYTFGNITLPANSYTVFTNGNGIVGPNRILMQGVAINWNRQDSAGAVNLLAPTGVSVDFMWFGTEALQPRPADVVNWQGGPTAPVAVPGRTYSLTRVNEWESGDNWSTNGGPTLGGPNRINSASSNDEVTLAQRVDVNSNTSSYTTNATTYISDPAVPQSGACAGVPFNRTLWHVSRSTTTQLVEVAVQPNSTATLVVAVYLPNTSGPIQQSTPLTNVTCNAVPFDASSLAERRVSYVAQAGRDYLIMVAANSELSYSIEVSAATCTNTTVGIYRASNASWFLRNSNSTGNADSSFVFGVASDRYITGDWDGDGDDTAGLFRPSNNTFYLKNSNVTGNADIQVQFGTTGDLPVVGDWNGDGTDTIGLYRPSTAQWFLKNQNTAAAPVVYSFTYGLANELPLAGDWDGNGADGVGIYRFTNSNFYLRNELSGGFANLQFQYGNAATEQAIIGDWNADCVDTVGVYRPSEGRFYLRNSNTSGFADRAFSYGLANETGVAGDWDGASNGPLEVGTAFMPSAANAFDAAVAEAQAAQLAQPSAREDVFAAPVTGGDVPAPIATEPTPEDAPSREDVFGS